MVDNEKKDNDVPEEEKSPETEEVKESAEEEISAEAEPASEEEEEEVEPASEEEEEVEPAAEEESEPVSAEAAEEEEPEEEVKAAEEEEEEEAAEVEEEEEEVGIPAREKVDAIISSYIRDDLPDFSPGDTVKVHVKIVEGNKERIQVFEGVVIAMKHGGIDRTFTVRKTSWGVGVERTFFLNSKKIHKIDVVRKGRVRRAKLYYLRKRAGKSARIRERRMTQG